jgi:hypothetical protein
MTSSGIIPKEGYFCSCCKEPLLVGEAINWSFGWSQYHKRECDIKRDPKIEKLMNWDAEDDEERIRVWREKIALMSDKHG